MAWIDRLDGPNGTPPPPAAELDVAVVLNHLHSELIVGYHPGDPPPGLEQQMQADVIRLSQLMRQIRAGGARGGAALRESLGILESLGVDQAAIKPWLREYASNGVLTAGGLNPDEIHRATPLEELHQLYQDPTLKMIGQSMYNEVVRRTKGDQALAEEMMLDAPPYLRKIGDLLPSVRSENPNVAGPALAAMLETLNDVGITNHASFYPWIRENVKTDEALRRAGLDPEAVRQRLEPNLQALLDSIHGLVESSQNTNNTVARLADLLAAPPPPPPPPSLGPADPLGPPPPR